MSSQDMSSQDMSSKEKNTPGEQVSQEHAITQEEQVVVSTETEEMVNQREELVDYRDERIAELEAVLNQTQQRERDNLLRAKAEIENIRRRSEQDVEKAHKFALERFVGELLPVIDNLERALDMSDKSNTELAPTIEGIELTLKSLLDAVRKFGLDIVSDKDVPFNPEVHQAMTMLESDHDEANKVIMVMQKGYILNGRLIRPAMVAVSKAKS